MREKQFQQLLVEAAGYAGWRVYHTLDSRGSQAGFPDLVLVRGSRLIFAELKADDGRVEPEQRDWLEALHWVAVANPTVEVYAWRPDDWDAIHSILARRVTRGELARR